MDDPAMWWSVFAMTLLFILNLLVSLSSTALVTMNDAQLAKLAEDGNKKAKRAVAMTERATRFTETVRLCNVLFGFGFSATALTLCYRPLAAVMKGTTETPFPVFELAAAFLTVLAAVVVWLLLSELLPRRIAAAKADTLGLKMIGFLRIVLGVLSPLQWLLTKLADGLSRLFGADPAAIDEEVTEEEIRMLVDVGEEKGVIEGSQKEMINNIFEFDDLSAADLMTPRTDVEAIEINDSVDEALAIATEHGISRLPVYEEDIDHVVGMLYIKDLLPYVGKSLPRTVTVRSLTRKTMFVPETKKCGELFSEMTAAHMHIAMIVDEYGGIAGIITMEDLLESIVGNMQDEYDDEEEEVTKLDDNHFEVDGTTDIDEVAELLDVELPEGDYDTLGGFLMSRLGRVPDTDEHPVIEFENAVFTVLSMDDRRIDTVHIELLDPPSEEAENEK